MARKQLFFIELEMENNFIIKITAPFEWGGCISQVAEHLAKELNNEEETFVVINDTVLRRAHIEKAIIRSWSVN